MKDLIRNILKECVSLKSNISEDHEKQQGANIKPNPTKLLKGSMWGDLSKGFSSDEVINNYSQSIWNIDPCPINVDIMDRIRKEYSENSGF